MENAEGVELLLGVDGALGEMDFPSAMQALQRGYELLDRTAHRLLGDRADGLRWHLTGLQEGSALTMLEASPTEEVTLAELWEMVDTYAFDFADPIGRLPEDDVPILRELLAGLDRTASGSLFTQRVGGGPRVTTAPAQVLPLLQTPADRPQLRVIGSVIGTLESLAVHTKREASFYNDVDKRRVLVLLPRPTMSACTLPCANELRFFGVLQEDSAGRPLRVRLQDIEVLPPDDDLPTLSSLIGSMPTLTGGLTPDEYLERNRGEMGRG